MDIVERVEHLIIEGLYQTLSVDDLKKMDSADDMIEGLQFDAVEDIKHEVWRMLLHNLNYKLMLEMLKDRVSEDSSTEISDEEESDGDE